MQVLTFVKAISVALALGAVSFTLTEWRAYRNSFGPARALGSSVPDTGRLVRRTIGSAILLSMSILMFLGRLPEAGQADQAEVLQLFYYWSAIVVLALILGCVAMYDALAGVKRLEPYMSAMEGQELSALARELKKQDAESGLLGSAALEET